MRTLATAVAMADVMTVPTAAKTLLKNPQRLLPLYHSEDYSNPKDDCGPDIKHRLRAVITSL